MVFAQGQPGPEGPSGPRGPPGQMVCNIETLVLFWFFFFQFIFLFCVLSSPFESTYFNLMQLQVCQIAIHILRRLKILKPCIESINLMFMHTKQKYELFCTLYFG